VVPPATLAHTAGPSDRLPSWQAAAYSGRGEDLTAWTQRVRVEASGLIMRGELGKPAGVSLRPDRKRIGQSDSELMGGVPTASVNAHFFRGRLAPSLNLTLLRCQRPAVLIVITPRGRAAGRGGVVHHAPVPLGRRLPHRLSIHGSGDGPAGYCSPYAGRLRLRSSIR
jgi:hypothetical protein